MRYRRAISNFSSSVYPANWMISILSRKGPEMVLSMLAVAMKTTEDRSNGAPR